MRGFLTRIIDRQIRRLTLGTTLGIVIVAIAGVAMSGHYEAEFDAAYLAVEKAQILLGPSLCGPTGGKASESCKKLVRTADELLVRARQAVTEAASVIEGGDAAVPRDGAEARAAINGPLFGFEAGAGGGSAAGRGAGTPDSAATGGSPTTSSCTAASGRSGLGGHGGGVQRVPNGSYTASIAHGRTALPPIGPSQQFLIRRLPQ